MRDDAMTRSDARSSRPATSLHTEALERARRAARALHDNPVDPESHDLLDDLGALAAAPLGDVSRRGDDDLRLALFAVLRSVESR